MHLSVWLMSVTISSVLAGPHAAPTVGQLEGIDIDFGNRRARAGIIDAGIAGVGLMGDYLNSASAATGMGTVALGALAIGSMSAAKNVAEHGITPLLNHQGMQTRRDGDPVIYHYDGYFDEDNLYHPYRTNS